ALTLQSIVPVLAIFPAAGVFLLVQFGAVNNYVPSYLIVPCLSIGPLIDPMITIYYVHPYRKIANNEKENADEKKICYSFDATMTITGPHVLDRTALGCTEAYSGGLLPTTPKSWRTSTCGRVRTCEL
ncbi:hypothetical protein TELCIR_17457, partial [Teladorsagia circumcincta]